jgi:RimJ/RimL family protein N-acetyltransferase
MLIPLFENYALKSPESDEQFSAFLAEYTTDIYPDSINLDLGLILSDEEKIGFRDLKINTDNLFRLRFFIMKGEEKIGWCYGAQIDAETFKMINTGIRKEHRGKGIYTKVLPVILNLLKEKGFQKVWSRHSAVNNHILIPKLKAGFIISGFEISDMFGVLVHLTYYFNETRRKVIDFRVGDIQPTRKIADALSLKIN